MSECSCWTLLARKDGADVDHKINIDPKVPIFFFFFFFFFKKKKNSRRKSTVRPTLASGPQPQPGLNNGWLSTVPDKDGWILPLLLYNPLHPKLDRTVRSSEIQPI